MKCTEHLQLRPHIRLWFGSFPHISDGALEHRNIGTGGGTMDGGTVSQPRREGGKAGLFPQNMNLQTPTSWWRAVPCLSGYRTRSSAKQRDISDVLTLLSAARGTVTPLHYTKTIISCQFRQQQYTTQTTTDTDNKKSTNMRLLLNKNLPKCVAP